MAITLNNLIVDEGTGVPIKMVEDINNDRVQIIGIGSVDKATAATVLADVKGSAPGATEVGLIVRMVAEAIANALFAKITDGTDVLAIDGSGNAMVALGAAIDRTSKPTLSDGAADRTLTINAENNLATNLLAMMGGKVHTSRQAFTNGNQAAEWFTPAGSPVMVEGAVDGVPTTGQVTVDTTATNGELILAANAMRRRAYLHNESATIAVYISYSATGLTITNGFRLAPGAYLPISHTKIVHGIVASGAAVVSYSEEVIG